MKIQIFLFVALLLLCGVSARAQQDSAARFVRIGIFGSAGANFHNPQSFGSFLDQRYRQYTQYAGFYPKLLFEPVSAFGWSAGGLVELPIFDRVGLSMRVSYSQVGARFVAFESTKVGIVDYDPIPMVVFRDIQIEHSADANSVAFLGIEPYLTYRPLDMLVLYVGVPFGTPLNRRYSYAERILDTDPRVIWINQTKVRNQYQDDITSMSVLNIGLSVGAGYEIPLDSNNQWLLAIEAFYTRFLSSLLQAPDMWTLEHLRGGVSLRYAPFAYGK